MNGKKAKAQRQEGKQHSIYWGSSYDRQLDVLLFMWPDILKRFPNAKLNICYGWQTFDALRGGNPERLQWKQNIERMMQQPGIIHWGRLGKEELKRVRQTCGIWAYPTEFPEINCITALECQLDGVVPVTMNHYALKETVGSGVKIDGDIHLMEIQEKYKESLIDLMGDTKKWKEESEKGKEFAKNYDWSNIASKWIEEFNSPIKTPKVSVITITIRSGFWNIMAKNLAAQTYKVHEWIIVDDYPEDRMEIAAKYAKIYNLNIKYLRGDKVMGKYHRPNGLSRSNNMGWKAAEGELLVYLQDFIIIPIVGIEMLVDVNRHNPNALVAPVDDYWIAKEANKKNKEDWWDGNTDIFDKFSWRNSRVQFLGLRETKNPFDFEMNYGLIPKHIIQKLNGWWEFMDEGSGYDNTEIAYRALQAGYKILIDDRNKALCINLWPVIGGTGENILNRERQLNPPRYQWFVKQMMEGKLPLVREDKLCENINLKFSVPDDVLDKDCSGWINAHTPQILEAWK
jgi:glycosyltransferase involved in cell wall biosynthesis